MTLFDHLKSRDLVHDHTPNVADYFSKAKAAHQTPRVYAGFDPSSQSLQIGNVVAALILRRAQQNGVQPLILLGGATGLVGDPSGKKAERTLLAKERAEENLIKIKKQLANLIDCDSGKYQGLFVNNLDWFSQLNYIEFLRDVGKHITINYMIAKDSVKLRMETGISYAEFGYMLMQGYDFLHLFEKYNCQVQLGGSDQWGNITTGIELIRRKHGAEAHAISTPLLTDSAGNKLGKTENGAIYIDPEITSPFQFYQYFINLPDSEVLKVLKALTLISDEQLQEVELRLKDAPEKREAQKLLAALLTDMIHGLEDRTAVEQATVVLFSKDSASLRNLSAATLHQLSRELPTSRLTTVSGTNIIDALVNSKLATSKGEARRHLQGGAVTINREKITDEKAYLNEEQFKSQGYLLLGIGKSKLHLLLKEL